MSGRLEATANPAGGGEEAAGRLARWQSFVEEDITHAWTDTVLLLSCFVTGLIDSAVFNVWSCFTSMQTGNTIYLGLGVSGQPHSQPWRWCKSLVAIAAFLAGAFLFGRLVHALGQGRRGTLLLSCGLQALLTYSSAALGSQGVVSKDAGEQLPTNFIVLLPLALLSMAAAGQCVLSRQLGFTEIPTVVLTSAYCDLVMDEDLCDTSLTQNPKRNRRFISSVLLLLGAIAGGYLTLEGDINLALWIAGTIKLVIASVWLFWKPAKSIQLE